MLSGSISLNNFGRNILITGGNSGIGFYSVLNFLENKNYLFIPIRSISRREIFIKKLKEHFPNNYLEEYLSIIDEVDFSNLENINKIRDYLFNKNIKLDTVILNAGLQYTGSLYPKVSKQGIELTFAVNHLAHFYLTNLLLPLIKDSLESRIIITSSEVHNPKSSGGNIGKKAGLNNLVGFKEEVMGKYLNFNADRAYKNSKLCNILFARELSQKIENLDRKISVITWAPGLVIPDDDLGFFRYSNKFNKYGYILFSNIAKNILGISESLINAGKILYLIAFNRDLNNTKLIYLSNEIISYKKHKLKNRNVSKEADDSELANKLWKLSEEICSLVGITLFDM